MPYVVECGKEYLWVSMSSGSSGAKRRKLVSLDECTVFRTEGRAAQAWRQAKRYLRVSAPASVIMVSYAMHGACEGNNPIPVRPPKQKRKR